MDFPPFDHHHHHHNRYAPPPPSSFPDDRPDLYPHHHLMPSVNFLPPPPSYPPIPPPPPPRPVPPPPPSYTPDFTFLDAQKPSYHDHNRFSPPPSRFTYQSNRFDYRTDYRSDPVRAPPEPSHRNPIAPEDHRRRVYSSNPQSENYYKPHGTERAIPSSRFRDDTINDGYAARDISNIVPQEQQVFRGGSNDIDRYTSSRSTDISTVSSARVMDDYVEKYEPHYMPMPENERIWNHHGEEDPKWVMKGKKNESGQKDRTSRGYEHESSKFIRAREGREEFKQVQKKSVLLRIGKPNNTHRNRNLVESNSSNYRGKDKVKDKDRDHTGEDLYLDKRIEGDRDRERSPVDLDVSFKSNALVAKPVVTPSSPKSDNNHTQTRSRKIKRANEFGSPLSKFSKRSTTSGNSPLGFDSPSSSEKAPKQHTDKDSVSNGGNSSLSGSVLDKGIENGGIKGPLSFRLKKKRKLLNPGFGLLNFQLGVKDTKHVNDENLKKTSPASTVPIPGAIPVPNVKETISSEVVKSPQAAVLEKDGSEVEKLKPHCTNSCFESKNFAAHDVPMKDDGLVKDFSQQLGENEISLNLESDTHQNISTDVKLSLGDIDNCDTSGHDQAEIEEGPAESYASFDVANVSNSLTYNCNTSGHDQVEIQKEPAESYTGFDIPNVFNDLCYGPDKMQDMNTIADMKSSDSCSDEIIIVSSDDDVSNKEDGSQLFGGTNNQISFNGSCDLFEEVKESAHAVVTEDNATPVDSLKEHSFDKDEITETVVPISTLVQTPSPDHSKPGTDSKDGLPPSLGIDSAYVKDTGAFVTDSNGNPAESLADALTDIFPSQKASSFPDLQMLINKSTANTLSSSSIPANDDNMFVKSVSEDVAVLKESRLEVTNTASSPSQGSTIKTMGSNSNLQGSNQPLKKPSSTHAVPRVLGTHSSPVFSNSRINKTVNNITKPRTWHRSSTSSASIPLPPKNAATDQSSYVRTGNSLVRKGAPATSIASRPSVYQLKPSESNSAGSGDKVNNTYTRIARPGPSAPVMRPKTPPLSGSTSLPASSPVELLPASPVEGNYDLQTVSEDQNRTYGHSESQKVHDEVVSEKKIQYVKPKSNQLVAALGGDQSIQELDKTQASSSSDSYYKRRKNQLIRTSVGDDSANTDVVKVSKSSSKRQSSKGVYKKYKHLRSSSVWMLNSQSLGKDGVSLHQKLRPQLFPWKRSRNTNATASIPSNSSSSFISRKLLLSRKRETVYTRSKHGFSLRISKLLSVGGSSLKWSKSIEKNSKKTNEEATLAVAAAEKRKREQHVTASATAGIKSKNNMSRERIFRIGSVRYKMDPSRRTLQRISDEEPSTSTHSKETIRKSYIPKRLKIGHEEYVRIGTGNQLVRNPKRRTRIFASEKVRWSLHTARSRLAKKKKFCQFFTRFGKCNKDDGKCPYIHDSSKIAVCTKFLNGLCFNPNCKLTHKVIPERMQDCSYFLQGMCSNKDCPYRHVNVNSAASICEGFLKGYCADGNECRRKHSYACPAFEATGACSQGAKCKLHHPRNQLKRKQQNSTEQNQKNSRGRYFGSYRSEEEATPASEKHFLKNDDLDDDDDVDGGIWCEGKYAEYISLGFGNEEGGEVGSEQRTVLISEPLGLGLGADEFDELTKPIGIMNG